MSIEVPNDQTVCCHKCAEGKTMGGIPISSCRLIVCTVCGNKRCPHATDHELACTGSNEPGQPGSLYPTAEPADIVANANAAKRQLLADLQAKTHDRMTNGGRRPLFDPESVPQQPGCRWFIKRDDALLLDRGFRTKAEASEWIDQLGYRLDWRVGFTFKLRGEPNIMQIANRSGEVPKP